MKRFFIVTLFIIVALTASILCFVKIYEKRLIVAFKNEIIDKTDLNIDFSDIHFSIFKNFPNGSFILDDANIFYSKHNRIDTLISSQKLCFKINAINLFRNVYDFPEIIIYDGLININIDKLDQFLPSAGGKNSNYIVNTNNIEFVRCRINYASKKDVKISIYIDKSSCSGSFLSKAISLNINFNILDLSIDIYGYKYKSQKPITLITTLNERDETYYSENGLLSLTPIKFNFSFLYSLKSDLLQITTSSNKLNAKKFILEFFPNLGIDLKKGDLSLTVLYNINFKKNRLQKLNLKYNLENVELLNTPNLYIKKLAGNTIFSNNFKTNTSEVDDINIIYNGIYLSGKSRIKNFPDPIILFDGDLRAEGNIEFNKDFSVNGNLKGKIKTLVKVENIKQLNIKNLNVLRIKSQIALNEFSINGMDFLNSLSGNINIDDNLFVFNGKGVFFNADFSGTCSFDNFLDVALREATISPTLNIEMENFNLDEIFAKVKSTSTKQNNNFSLTSRIEKVRFREFDLKDFTINLKGQNGNYLCSNFSFKTLSGDITGNFFYSENDTSSLSIIGRGINITNLFKGFNNFKQTIITGNNISGTVSGKVDLHYKSSDKTKIDPMSIKANSSIIIENGKLVGVSQLKKISKFLNLSEIDSIRFMTLQNKIEIDKGIIKIPSMEISSNALNFRISGEHNFNNEFTYWLKINLREILAKKFKSKKEYNPNIESDNKEGLNLFLKLYGNENSYKIVYDRKSGVNQLKSNLSLEGQLLKNIIKEEFKLSKNKTTNSKDTTSLNYLDSIHNKNRKKSFKIEWEEIDSSKVNNH